MSWLTREAVDGITLERMDLDAMKRGEYRLTATLSDALEERPVVVIAWEGTPGFGMLTISRENGRLVVDTEGMSAKFVAAALDAFKSSVLEALASPGPECAVANEDAVELGGEG